MTNGLGSDGCLSSDSNSKPIGSERHRCDRHSEGLEANTGSLKFESPQKLNSHFPML